MCFFPHKKRPFVFFPDGFHSSCWLSPLLVCQTRPVLHFISETIFQLQTRIGVIEGLYIETGWWFGTCCFHILGISSYQPTRKHHSKISLLDPSDWQNLNDLVRWNT
jgi:hypothetical protein